MMLGSVTLVLVVFAGFVAALYIALLIAQALVMAVGWKERRESRRRNHVRYQR